jgi:aminoglycoside 3-N-acetyltransferase
MLGAPLDTITLLHHAEYRAALRHKQVIRYPCPILRDGQTVWVDVEDFATGDPHDDYRFEAIARDYVTLNRARRETVGQAETYLFDAADLVAYAVQWLEARFGA